MKKIVALIFLVLTFFTLYINEQDSNNNEFIPAGVEDICGEYPSNYVKPDINNDPNYVFLPDSDYSSVRLLDEFENVVFVNSFIECEHYVLGGWNFVSNVDFKSANKNFSLEECQYSQRLIDYIAPSDKVYITNIKLIDLVTSNAFSCLGKIESLEIKNGTSNFWVFYSRDGYIFFSQMIPLSFLFFRKRFKNNFLLWFLIFYQMIIQYIFNYYFGLNLFNSVSIFTTLILFLYLKEGQDESIK